MEYAYAAQTGVDQIGCSAWRYTEYLINCRLGAKSINRSVAIEIASQHW